MEDPPLPHDLTGLQQEANTRLGMAAGQTLAVVQRLYERGYVSYPRTGCCHIPGRYLRTGAHARRLP
ncbi:DNA topoisomerase [Bacteroides thetaiotaomicron]|nr:DNA topoisomerase [Bacteroides thetaiotaomicron]